MTVVSNAGPLIALARIGRLDLFETLFGEIVVPPAVFAEVTRNPDLPGASDLEQGTWLVVRPVADEIAVQRLRFWLDLGESEAIILSQELGATLLIDERRGRAVATTLGVRVTGTIGLLLAAKHTGYIPAVLPLLDALLASGIRLSPRLYEEARRLAGES
ncbi:MAG: DUF3368 domain-containing protein [Anaerolineae bacterium]